MKIAQTIGKQNSDETIPKFELISLFPVFKGNIAKYLA